MSKGRTSYRIGDQNALHYLTFATVNWIDVFPCLCWCLAQHGYKRRQRHQQTISKYSYAAAILPVIYQSGSSIKGKSKICKQGGDELRHTLYMCALNAKENNLACKQLYERLVAKGKNKKLLPLLVFSTAWL